MSKMTASIIKAVKATRTQAKSRITVPITLTNRWAIFRSAPDIQMLLKPYFRYHLPGAEFSEAFRSGSWDGNVNLLQRGRVAAGLFLEKRAELEEKFKIQITDVRSPLEFLRTRYSDKVRPYQREAVDAMIAASNTGGLVLSATGSGKTFLTSEYFRRLIGTAVFLVDELTLLAQAQKEIEKALNEKVGVVGKSEFRPCRITVATIQTLHKHRERRDFRAWFSKLDVMIIDEVHTAINRRNIDIVRRIQPRAVFGLTATLQMEKQHVRLPVVALTGPVIFAYPIQQGTDEGYLSQGIVCRLKFQDTLRGASPGYWSETPRAGEKEKTWIPAGSRAADYRYHITLNKARNDCIEELAREGVRQGLRIVVLVERLAHLHTLSRRLHDVPHQVACGSVEQEQRIEAMRAMDADELPLILANRVFGKGVDIRRLDTIIDATALPGRNGTMQRYGRGARKAEGKEKLRYIDIADHGNPFQDAAKSRLRAFREIGCAIVEMSWKNGTAAQILEQVETVKGKTKCAIN